MHDPRPKNLNLFTIRFPAPAIVSILHRISGVVLFFTIPIVLWGLQISLTEPGFSRFHMWFSNTYVHIFFWLVLIPFIFHLVAGIRHLLSDIHIGDTLVAGKVTANLTFIISILLIVLAGIWLW